MAMEVQRPPLQGPLRCATVRMAPGAFLIPDLAHPRPVQEMAAVRPRTVTQALGGGIRCVPEVRAATEETEALRLPTGPGAGTQSAEQGATAEMRMPTVEREEVESPAPVVPRARMAQPELPFHPMAKMEATEGSEAVAASVATVAMPLPMEEMEEIVPFGMAVMGVMPMQRVATGGRRVAVVLEDGGETLAADF